MKKLIFISIILSLIVVTASAQGISTLKLDNPTALDNSDPGGAGTDLQYPYAKGTITRSGYTYKYRHSHFAGGKSPEILDLYNATNTYLDVEWKHRDGSPLSLDEAMGLKPNSYYFSSASQTADQTLEMVNGLFTTQQKTALNGKSINIELRINSSTGRVTDVYFTFFRKEPFISIPVETYRSIELALKQNLTVAVTDQGRKMNYLQLFWSQEF